MSGGGLFPNVVIVGAPKCGTTSLFSWLADHPEVCGSIVKEARYFLDPDDPLFKNLSNYRDHGLAGYETYFEPCEATDSALVVEATPVYLFQRSAPAAIAQIEPLPHIVIVFRKPSERVYSHFHFLRDSHARIDSRLPFDEFVRLVQAGDPAIPHYGHAKSVIDHSRYVDFLPAWFERFPRAHVHLFLFEHLRRDPAAFMRSVAEEFDIDPSFYDSYPFSRKNTTFRIRHPSLHRIRRGIGRRLPADTRKRIKASTASAYARINIEPARKSRTDADAEALVALDRYFAPFNDRLAGLTGLDLTAWR
jgi:Sulfotransferase domain